MKTNYSIIVLFLIQDQENIAQLLHSSLQNHIRKYYLETHVDLISCIDYWKVPGEKEIIYQINSHYFLSVELFIQNFHIHWKFHQDTGYSPSLEKETSSQSAVWSKLCHPEETYLLPLVTWVHIYTWDE